MPGSSAHGCVSLRPGYVDQYRENVRASEEREKCIVKLNQSVPALDDSTKMIPAHVLVFEHITTRTLCWHLKRSTEFSLRPFASTSFEEKKYPNPHTRTYPGIYSCCTSVFDSPREMLKRHIGHRSLCYPFRLFIPEGQVRAQHTDNGDQPLAVRTARHEVESLSHRAIQHLTRLDFPPYQQTPAQHKLSHPAISTPSFIPFFIHTPHVLQNIHPVYRENIDILAMTQLFTRRTAHGVGDKYR